MNEKAETPSEDTANDIKLTGRSRLGKGYVLLIIVVFFLSLVFLTRREAINTIDCTADIIDGKPDVIMLGAWWCSYCYQAKRYFQKNNISYCEYDMEHTATGKQLYQEHGAGAVPILLIGEYQINGYSEQQIETALSLLKNKQNTQ